MAWVQSLTKLVFFLIVLPASFTFLHLRYTLHRANLCFVTPESHIAGVHVETREETVVYEDLYGIYQAAPSGDGRDIIFSRISDLHRGWHWHWPSVAYASAVLTGPTAHRRAMEGSSPWPVLRYLSDRWCWQSPSGKICSSQTTDDTRSPPSGLWTNGALSIRISHIGPTAIQTTAQSAAGNSSTWGRFRRNPNKRIRQNRNIEQLLQRPATTLLMAVNILLAFLYWNRSVAPSDVSKVYNKIVIEGELWRSFSGATAHFEPLHLGFNMMALYSLGAELEELYGSIPFLFYNISLIPITTIIMMAAINLQIRRTGNTGLGETSTVGYSGVLFAWMVVASLERQETCPVPFMPSMCFSTHQLGIFKFNIGPIVQLFVAQFIMPRVSFVGHLAGIVAGFALHWNLLPLDLMQPATLLPAIFLAYLWRVRRIIPIVARRENESSGDNENDTMIVDQDSCDEESPAGRFDARRQKQERDMLMLQNLVYTRNALVVMIVLSAWAFDPLGGMILCPLLGLVLFHFGVKCLSKLIAAANNPTDYHREKSILGTLWRGFVVSSILTIVTDSMTVSTWIVSRVDWQGGGSIRVGLLPACLLLLIRLCVQVMALCFATKNLSDIGETGSGGIFVNIFGATVLENARLVGQKMITLLLMKRSTVRTAFEGRGLTLGRPSSIAVEGS